MNQRKPTNYAPHLLISLFAFCVIVSWPGCYNEKKECHYEYGECPDKGCVNYPPEILSKKINDRGLIIVVYVDGPDTVAYDYLSREEYKEIFRKLTVKVDYYKNGDVLLPSYACVDTLIVLDADGLNADMALIEQGVIDGTDSDIDSILHIHCKIK
jgi:hypothetical protein